MTAEEAVMLVKKVAYLGEFGYVHFSRIRKCIRLSRKASTRHRQMSRSRSQFPRSARGTPGTMTSLLATKNGLHFVSGFPLQNIKTTQSPTSTQHWIGDRGSQKIIAGCIWNRTSLSQVRSGYPTRNSITHFSVLSFSPQRFSVLSWLISIFLLQLPS